MFSMPPATAASWRPSRTSCAAVTIACAPEPQTRLTVMAGTETGSPPRTAAWRAGFMRLPAWTTLPMTTPPIRPGSRPERASVSRTAAAPSSVAGTPLRVPLYAPIAVRTGWHRTTSDVLTGFSLGPWVRVGGALRRPSVRLRRGGGLARGGLAHQGHHRGRQREAGGDGEEGVGVGQHLRLAPGERPQPPQRRRVAVRRV